jgi:L-iditol 2-dehydrogenase
LGKEETMLQAVLEHPHRIVMKNAAKPFVNANDVLIKVKRIGICGSDIHAYHGKHPYVTYPFVQGHEFSGEVVETGNSVNHVTVGDRVTVTPQLVCGTCFACTHGRYNICDNLRVLGFQADGAAQEYFCIHKDLVIKLPESMEFDAGAMVEPVAVGVHALKRSDSIKGKRILVIGAGTIGNMTAQAARALGAEGVMITDIIDERLSIARHCGIEQTVNVQSDDLNGSLTDYFGQEKADLIVECVGEQASIEQAINVARKGTDIIVVGVFGKSPKVDMGLVQDRELRLIGTLMYLKEDYMKAIELLSNSKIGIKPLISCYFPFQRYDEAYAYIDKNKEKTLKVMIDMELV